MWRMSESDLQFDVVSLRSDDEYTPSVAPSDTTDGESANDVIERVSFTPIQPSDAQSSAVEDPAPPADAMLTCCDVPPGPTGLITGGDQALLISFKGATLLVLLLACTMTFVTVVVQEPTSVKQPPATLAPLALLLAPLAPRIPPSFTALVAVTPPEITSKPPRLPSLSSAMGLLLLIAILLLAVLMAVIVGRASSRASRLDAVFGDKTATSATVPEQPPPCKESPPCKEPPPCKELPASGNRGAPAQVQPPARGKAPPLGQRRRKVGKPLPSLRARRLSRVHEEAPPVDEPAAGFATPTPRPSCWWMRPSCSGLRAFSWWIRPASPLLVNLPHVPAATSAGGCTPPAPPTPPRMPLAACPEIVPIEATSMPAAAPATASPPSISSQLAFIRVIIAPVADPGPFLQLAFWRMAFTAILVGELNRCARESVLLKEQLRELQGTSSSAGVDGVHQTTADGTDDPVPETARKALVDSLKQRMDDTELEFIKVAYEFQQDNKAFDLSDELALFISQQGTHQDAASLKVVTVLNAMVAPSSQAA